MVPKLTKDYEFIVKMQEESPEAEMKSTKKLTAKETSETRLVTKVGFISFLFSQQGENETETDVDLGMAN